MEETKQQLPIPQGSLFTFATGEYSDYTIHGVFRALKEIDVPKVMDEFTEQDAKNYNWSIEQRFCAYLVVQGYMQPVDCHELHVENIGRGRKLEYQIRDYNE